MKRINHISILVLAVLSSVAISSCDVYPVDKETAEEQQETGFAVTKSDVVFNASASKGTIEVNATDISASCDADWVTLSSAANTIAVAVTENTSLVGRSAKVIIKSGADEASVVVTQRGYVVELLQNGTSVTGVVLGDEASTTDLTLNTNVPVELSCNATWMNIAVDGSDVTVTASENSSGHLRSSWVYYKTAAAVDSIKFTQFNLEKDFTGAARMYYYNTSGKYYYMNVTISASDITLSSGLKIPYTFDSENVQLKVYGLASMGTVSEKDYYMTFWDTDKGYLTWNTGVSVDFPLEYDEEGGYTYAELTDNGSWSGYTITALRPNQFTVSGSTYTRGSSYYAYLYPMLVKFDE